MKNPCRTPASAALRGKAKDGSGGSSSLSDWLWQETFVTAAVDLQVRAGGWFVSRGICAHVARQGFPRKHGIVVMMIYGMLLI